MYQLLQLLLAKYQVMRKPRPMAPSRVPAHQPTRFLPMQLQSRSCSCELIAIGSIAPCTGSTACNQLEATHTTMRTVGTCAHAQLLHGILRWRQDIPAVVSEILAIQSQTMLLAV